MANIFLTGASSGIGRAVALRYGQKGARLFLCARREEELNILAKEISANGTTPIVCPLDVTSPDAVKEALTRACREMGTLDRVIANAGVSNDLSKKIEWESVANILQVNVIGSFATLVHAIPILLKQGHGHLVGVSSLAGRRGLPRSSAYSASKAALSTFLETLRRDFERKNIRVTDVQPGFVTTPMTAKNKFKMPFLWDAQQAAEYIVAHLEKAPAIVAFPAPLDYLTEAMRILPTGAYDLVSRNILEKRMKP